MLPLDSLDSTEGVFDQAATHLLTQKRRSFIQYTDGSTQCKYKLILEDGTILKCAAGCFISDEEYNKGYEGISWDNLVTMNFFSDVHTELIHELQVVHDNVCDNDFLKLIIIRLNNIAEDFNLSTNILKNF